MKVKKSIGKILFLVTLLFGILGFSLNLSVNAAPIGPINEEPTDLTVTDPTDLTTGDPATGEPQYIVDPGAGSYVMQKGDIFTTNDTGSSGAGLTGHSGIAISGT